MAGAAAPNTNRLTPARGEMAPLLTPAPRRTGQTAGTTYTQAEAFGASALGERGGLAGHNVPAAFWEHMKRSTSAPCSCRP